MLKLKPVVFGEEKTKLILDDHSKRVFNKIQAMYNKNGFSNPWIGYFAMIDHEIVGSCGFKNQPQNDKKVEIAYATFPKHEGKGYASEMCRLLINVALSCDESIVLTAETLKNNFASHRILQKNAFVLLDKIAKDPVHGELMVWEYSHKK